MHLWRLGVADGLAIQEEREEGPVPLQLLQARHGDQRGHARRAGDAEPHRRAEADLHHPGHGPVLAEGLLAKTEPPTTSAGRAVLTRLTATRCRRAPPRAVR